LPERRRADDERWRQARGLRPQGRPRDDQRAEEIKLVKSVITGLSPVNGYWDSDHAGVVSTLKIS
jgi:hypothetical protein